MTHPERGGRPLKVRKHGLELEVLKYRLLDELSWREIEAKVEEEHGVSISEKALRNFMYKCSLNQRSLPTLDPWNPEGSILRAEATFMYNRLRNLVHEALDTKDLKKAKKHIRQMGDWWDRLARVQGLMEDGDTHQHLHLTQYNVELPQLPEVLCDECKAKLIELEPPEPEVLELYNDPNESHTDGRGNSAG